MKLFILLLITSCLVLCSGAIGRRKMYLVPIGKDPTNEFERQLKLLENLDLQSLLLVAQVNDHMSALATEIFQRHYSSKTVEISNYWISNHGKSIYNTTTTISIHDHQLASVTLRLFGPMIQKLSLLYNGIGFTDRQDIHKLISTHCTKPFSMMLGDFDEAVLKTIQKPFEKAKNLTITGLITTEVNSMPLNDIFPEIRRLHLDIDAVDAVTFAVKFPKLQHVSIGSKFSGYIPNYTKKMLAALKELFVKNQQIQSISFDCHSMSFLKIASEFLPNLDSIQVKLMKVDEKYVGEKFHFNGVKTLKWWALTDLTEVATFNSLEEVYMNCSYRDCLNFAKQNQHLKKVFIVAFSLNDERVKELAGYLPHLEDLHVISKDIQNGKALNEYFKGKLKHYQFEHIEENYIHKRMEQEMHIGI